jgi:hypothetical protein
MAAAKRKARKKTKPKRASRAAKSARSRVKPKRTTSRAKKAVSRASAGPKVKSRTKRAAKRPVQRKTTQKTRTLPPVREDQWRQTDSLYESALNEPNAQAGSESQPQADLWESERSRR